MCVCVYLLYITNNICLIEINTFIHQGCTKLMKSDSRDIYNVTKDVLLTFLFIKEYWQIKCITVSKKYLLAQLFSEMFLEQQISILEWFLKNHVTENWSNDAENSALITAINYIYIHIENSYLNYNISLFLLYFWSTKYYLGEQKKLLSQTLILPTPNFWMVVNVMCNRVHATQRWTFSKGIMNILHWDHIISFISKPEAASVAVK